MKPLNEIRRVLLGASIALGEQAGGGQDGPQTPLEDAIWAQESSRCTADCPTGDDGDARGPLQIHYGAWSDIAGEGDEYSDVDDLDYSLEIFRGYMDRYCPDCSDEDKARTWNGGPNGVNNENTEGYGDDVQTIIDSGVFNGEGEGEEETDEGDTYTVRPGDNLWQISGETSAGLAAWQEANPGINYDVLSIGQVLARPAG